MRSYVGPLLDPLSVDVDVVDESVECDGSFAHYGARANVLTAICMGMRVRLVRRKMLSGHGETTGEVIGQVYGLSSDYQGRMVLAVQQDDGECVGVDVSEPRDWVWEVSHG